MNKTRIETAINRYIKIPVAVMVAATAVAALGSDNALDGSDAAQVKYSSKASSSLPTVRVATFNIRNKNTVAQTKQDIRRLLRISSVDIVGFQEADNVAAARAVLQNRGFALQTFDGKSSRQNAVAWRTSKFKLLRSDLVQAHPGGGGTAPSKPFPTRWMSVLTFEHLPSGQEVRFFNTHINQRAEDNRGGRLGRWTNTENAVKARIHFSKWQSLLESSSSPALSTCDCNVDFGGDRRWKPKGGFGDTVGRHSVTTFEAFGIPSKSVTHPKTKRNLDYVMADRRSVERGDVRMVRQRVLSGFNSDHNAVIARFQLNLDPMLEVEAPSAIAAGHAPKVEVTSAGWRYALSLQAQDVRTGRWESVESARASTRGDATFVVEPPSTATQYRVTARNGNSGTVYISRPLTIQPKG